MTTTVVHVRQPHDVYIGRGRPGYTESPFANPFIIGPHGLRAEVIARYEHWLRAKLYNNPELQAELEKLRGKRLGCWCKPQACHGDVLVELLHGPQRKTEQGGLF